MGAPLGNQFALNNEGGRPTTYDPSIILQVEEYLTWCESNPLIVDEGGGKKRKTPRLPSVARFSIRTGIPRTTLIAWAEANKEFSTAFQKILDHQEAHLLETGGAGDGNSRFKQFILSAKHDYREKADVTSAGAPIQGVVNILKPDEGRTDVQADGKAV